jgi:hypothetical protein
MIRENFLARASAIIRLSHLTLYPSMLFGVPRLKKSLFALAVSFLGSALLVSCGSYSSGTKPPSGLTFRAFVSNPLHESNTGAIFPALEIVDASKDIISATAGVSLAGVLPDAGMMALSPKRDRTLVVSPSSNVIAVVDNATEVTATAIALPAPTESLFVWTDNTSAFVAIPNAPIPGQSPGGVGRFNIVTAAVTATIPIPGAHYLVSSPTGNQILVFSDNSDSVTLLFPALLGTGSQTSTQVPCSGASVVACAVSGFDRPVWGVFSPDGSTAYVFDCGLECGGSGNASIVPLNLGTETAGAPIPLVSGGLIGGATVGLLSGNLLYVAGTPPGTACGMGTLAQNCGVLSVVDVTASSVTSAQLIPDGYHNRIQMGANGQLFVGSRTCENVTTPTETRGCLAIYDTVHSKVTVPPQNGDVTGIEIIPNRTVVYVCQGGSLQIYDTTTDQLQTTQVTIVGQAIDVKVVDF